MASAHTPPRMPRLGIFTSRSGAPKSGPSSPLSRELSDRDEDWYIPYNGPYEPPPNPNTPESRDSWGELLNGLLSEGEEGEKKSGGKRDREGRVSHAASAPESNARTRALSNASRLTQTTGAVDQSRRTTAAGGAVPRSNPQPRAPVRSIVGGVGESPMPVERSAPQAGPSTPQRDPAPAISHRTSLASIFTFGRRSLRLSSSMDNVKREKADPATEPPVPPLSRTTPGRARANTSIPDSRERLSPADEYYDSYYSTLLVTPAKERPPMQVGEYADDPFRAHPYAHAYAGPPEESQSAPPIPTADKGKGRMLMPRITLLDPRGPKVPNYLKPSPRSSVLKASISTPNLRNIPKGKQRWLAAETWCDALILPRPRFAMRLIDPAAEGSGRIVSPPPSPIMPGHSPEPNESIQQRPGTSAQQAAIKKARSTGNIPAPSPPPPPPPQEVKSPQQSAGVKSSRPPRPKSWAWDDLALPSPVPSLAQVLEEGRQLKEERKEWQSRATRSFLDKQAHNVSRARSKSIGASRRSPRNRSGERAAFESLAERTLLGSQTRPPTIHVRSPSASRTSQSQTQTQSGTAQGTFQSTASYGRTFSRSGTGSRTRSHAHSNSLGNSTYITTSAESSGMGHSHTRSHSLGKSAFKLVVSTASSAAAFCGFASSSSDRGSTSPMSEKQNAMEHAIQTPGTRVIRLEDQIRAEDQRPDRDNLVVISPSAQRNGFSSPTPSGTSGSGEGVGLAITKSDDHSRQPGREPIRFAAHPYAQNPGYSHLSPVNAGPRSDDVPGPSFAVEEQVNTHRQPVQVHPYAQPGHPYASSGPRTSHKPRHLTIPSPSRGGMFAELTPGHVREVAPEDIRYSPDIPTPSVIVDTRSSAKSNAVPSTSGHPYAIDPKRTSELVFGDALLHTMRRASVDSGLGDSNPGWRSRAIDLSPDSAFDDIVRIHNVVPSSGERSELYARPYGRHQASGGELSNHTAASSPPEQLIPPVFRRIASDNSTGQNSVGTDNGNSSGSSPAMMSHDSSPPLSPRPITTSEDLDRYRDLFYRPSYSSDSREDIDHPIMSRRPSGSITFDVSSRSTRSGLSTLARQLSQDLEEMRREYTGSRDELSEIDEQHVWGSRHGSLQSSHPTNTRDTPNIVTAQLASPEGASPRSRYDSPLRLPIDTSFVDPSTNVPEDIESSRASSILELPNTYENPDPAESLRLGAVEAVLTPPIISPPDRFSMDVSLHGHGPVEDTRFSEDSHLRPISGSTLLTPLSPNARSSYMTSNTDTSRMSGLSDFPSPPSMIPPADMSSTSLAAFPPRLVRELSHGTFGRQDDDGASSTIGQAL